MQKTSTKLTAVIIALAIIIGLAFMKTYNNLQVMDEQISGNWAQVENQLKRRNDLIPNLVNVVKGYADYEKGVFTEIADARSKLAGSISQKDVKSIQQNSNELNSALSRLLAIAENYPELKANQNFIALQDELAGTENRLATARRDYNESIKKLNALVRTFPTSIVAYFAKIDKKDYFEVTETEKAAPKVEF